jgi:hypothetical protein
MAGTLTIDTLKASSGVLATQNGMTGIAKAWINYNGSAQTISGSFNVSSVTYSATGKYIINFTTAMPNANYAVACTGSNTSGSSFASLGSLWYASNASAGALTTTTCAVVFISQNGLSSYENPFNACVTVFSS